MNDPKPTSFEDNKPVDQAVATLKPVGLPFVLSDEELARDKILGGEMGVRDIAIPFLYVLQSNSPQAMLEHPKYIPGATATMLVLTNIEKVYEGKTVGLEFIPVYYERELVEWRDRNAGGGIVRSYDKDDPIQDKVKFDQENKPRLPNGNLLVETAYHMILVKRPDNGALTYTCMPLKSTALKESRKLNNMVSDARIPGTEIVAPRFMYRYRITTMREQRDTQIWSNPRFQQIGPVESREVYEHARKFAMAGAEALSRARETEDPTMSNVGMGDNATNVI